MINLAKKDIAHSLGKFLVTAMGVGMLLGMVLIMIGVYRGMVVDAEILINDINADLWVVQENSMGPFAESSRVHEDLKYSINIIDGIKHSEAITFQNIQLPKNPMPIRVMAVGYDPFGKINPINEERLIAGTKLTNDHFQIVVSKETGFNLQDKIILDNDIYEVVGITEKTVSSSGDILIYISLKDAQKLQFSYSNNRIRSDRERGIKNSDVTMVNAIVATVKEGYNTQEVAQNIKEWKYKSVYTKQEQKEILTKNLIERSAKQIGLFTAILILVSTIIIALIIYTMTLEKMKEISIMKLIGIPNSVIIKMIVQETLLLGVLAFISGNIFAYILYDKFPKRVVLEIPDGAMLFVVVVIASILSSFIGVKKVISADPASAIGG
ncbi:MAG: ABC transporter permease [Aliarcobacter sp.]|nr:ABC transporter permease [Aliarcobacter sp.]